MSANLLACEWCARWRAALEAEHAQSVKLRNRLLELGEKLDGGEPSGEAENPRKRGIRNAANRMASYYFWECPNPELQREMEQIRDDANT